MSRIMSPICHANWHGHLLIKYNIYVHINTYIVLEKYNFYIVKI